MVDTFKAMAICDDSWYVLLNHLRQIFWCFSSNHAKTNVFFWQEKRGRFFKGKWLPIPKMTGWLLQCLGSASCFQWLGLSCTLVQRASLEEVMT